MTLLQVLQNANWQLLTFGLFLLNVGLYSFVARELVRARR